MFSAFWEKDYQLLFNGSTLLTHPQKAFPLIGQIISHGYLVTGILPIRIALNVGMLLGPTASIPDAVHLNTFINFISREILRDALTYKECESFPEHIQEVLINTLSIFGCRTLPSPSNLSHLLNEDACIEFMIKPAAGIALVNSGIPAAHVHFWEKETPCQLKSMYLALTLSPSKVNSLIVFPPYFHSPSQARVAGYFEDNDWKYEPSGVRCIREIRCW